jgi:hypothetical protein
MSRKNVLGRLFSFSNVLYEAHDLFEKYNKQNKQSHLYFFVLKHWVLELLIEINSDQILLKLGS